MSDRFTDWDGAYVMGALSRSERLEYESHLETCEDCAEAVAELGSLPGLLGRLSPEDAELLLNEPVADAPVGLAERTLAALPPEPSPWWHRGALRSTRTRVGLAAAAAVVVAAGVVTPLALGHQDHGAPSPTVAVALQQTVPSPLAANVSLTSVRWGTRVDMVCTYASTGGAYVERPYSLYVVDRGGRSHLVSSWHAGPGETARTTGSTDLAVADIASVQLRGGDGRVLLQSPVSS